MSFAPLTEHQREIARKFLEEEQRKRYHVVIALSGAHAYGFPSPDSDLDLKSIHIDPTRARLGLHPPEPGAERLEVVQGVELDYSSNEIGAALSGVLKGNGNFIERVLGPFALQTSALHLSLQPVVRRSLCRKVYRHYQGFAMSQRAQAETARTAKKILYVLRTALTGVHLLKTGELITDLNVLSAFYSIDAEDLLEIKRSAERVTLNDKLYAGCKARMDKVFALLDEAHAASVLPAEPPNEAEIEAWLIDARLSRIA